MAENDNLIVLKAEDGNDVEFEYLDFVEYKDKEFVVLQPTEAPENEDEEGVVILRLSETDDKQELLPVYDDEELQSVFEIFQTHVEDDSEFVQ